MTRPFAGGEQRLLTSAVRRRGGARTRLRLSLVEPANAGGRTVAAGVNLPARRWVRHAVDGGAPRLPLGTLGDVTMSPIRADAGPAAADAAGVRDGACG